MILAPTIKTVSPLPFGWLTNDLRTIELQKCIQEFFYFLFVILHLLNNVLYTPGINFETFCMQF